MNEIKELEGLNYDEAIKEWGKFQHLSKKYFEQIATTIRNHFILESTCRLENLVILFF